jgi:glyoxylase-like metal-dependent hydrolase (beta-lactamase superfamily II)
MLLTIGLCLIVVAIRPEPQKASPPGYEWHELGGGVYVHRRTDPLAGPVDGNSVVIVNTDDVFVVDTHVDPAAARAVIARIRSITDNPVTHVINTHWHDDHTNGNHTYREAFPEARIIAHSATIRTLEAEWQAMEDQRRAAYESVRGRDLIGAAEALEATDPQRAIGIRVFAGYRDALEPELPTLELAYPDRAVDSRRTFERATRQIVVESLGAGNTEGDLVVWLPEESILITGDILVSPIPFAFDAPMLDWVNTLRRIDQYGARYLVPGHGPVLQGSQYLGQVVALLEETVDAVRDARARGVEYAGLEQSVDLRIQERIFTQGEVRNTYAWRSYFLTPGLQSAWKALGYPVPDGIPPD